MNISWNMKKSGLQKKKIFWSETRVILEVDTYVWGQSSRYRVVLQRGGMPSEIALQVEASSPKLCIDSRGRCGLRKPKNIFGL